jgi:glycosyltransferase involved in cell wall biosynthesis
LDLKIGILTTSLPSGRTGGAEVQAAKIAGLLSRRHEVTVFTRSVPSLDQHSEADSGTIEICRRSRIGIPSLRFPADIVGTLWVLGRRRSRLDVLVAYQSVIDGLLGVLAKLLFGIPVLVSVRSEKEYRLERSRLIGIVSPFVFRHADRLAVQTPTVGRELLKSLQDAGLASLAEEVRDKLTVLPNGISLRTVEPGRPQGNAVLYVGRLIEAKGVAYLVEAMRECPREELLIVGDGPEMERLRRAAGDLGNIRFEGRASREELDAHFRRARVLVLPSLRDEGMPNVIMEAMTRGLPVIATRNAGIPDLVKDGETGLLVEPGDSSALALAIRRIGAEQGLGSRLGAEGLREVRRYDWQNVLAAMERELEALAGAPSESTGSAPVAGAKG